MKQGQEIVAKFPGILIIHQKIRGKRKGQHHHEEHEFFLPLQGEIGVEVQGQRLTAGAGKMIYLPPGIEHSFTSAEEAEGDRLFFFVEKKTWEKFGGGTFEARTFPASQLSKELLFHLLIHPETKATKALCETLVQTLSEMLEQPGKTEVAHLTGKVQDERVKKVLAHIQENFQENVSMDELAKSSGLSVRNLNRLFLEETGLTPKQAITLHRMEEAKNLLALKKSVTEVAFDVGYNSVSQFITTFRSVTGKLPTEFRA
jgi:AraC-like DNA-binding protein/mannose-6-phosphate isomerase-like protein (cupin superfamily)